VTDNRTTLAMLSEQLADAVATAGAALVAVHARPRLPSTGVHWKDGVVVTTEGTIRREDDIEVTLPDGRHIPATLAGRDRGTDLAVLRIASGSLPWQRWAIRPRCVRGTWSWPWRASMKAARARRSARSVPPAASGAAGRGARSTAGSNRPRDLSRLRRRPVGGRRGAHPRCQLGRPEPGARDDDSRRHGEPRDGAAPGAWLRRPWMDRRRHAARAARPDEPATAEARRRIAAAVGRARRAGITGRTLDRRRHRGDRW